jgi:hypothetical protein
MKRPPLRVWFLFLLLSMHWGSLQASTASQRLSALATLSARSSKPHDPVELLVTVIHSANRPEVMLPQEIGNFQIKVLHKPRLLAMDGGAVWLFRYRLTPKQIGDYEISPIRILDGNQTVETRPLFLHVSAKGELPPLSAKELAAGVDIPVSLGEEVLKAAPQPSPRPTPTPPPADQRDWRSKAGDSCWKLLKSFWNYPGK